MRFNLSCGTIVFYRSFWLLFRLASLFFMQITVSSYDSMAPRTDNQTFIFRLRSYRAVASMANNDGLHLSISFSYLFSVIPPRSSYISQRPLSCFNDAAGNQAPLFSYSESRGAVLSQVFVFPPVYTLLRFFLSVPSWWQD